MAGLLSGLMGSAFSQDPNTTFGERMEMNFTPEMYAGIQKRAEEAATEKAFSDPQYGLTPGMAHAWSLNPELMRLGAPGVLPQAEQMQAVPTPGGGSTILGHKVGPGGHVQVNPLSVGGNAPHTTPNPIEATSPPPQAPPVQQQPPPTPVAPPPVQGGGGPMQGAEAPPPPIEPPVGVPPAPGAVPPPAAQEQQPQLRRIPNRPGVIPGSYGDMQDQILANRQAGIKGDALLPLLPAAWQDTIKALHDGSQSVKDLSTRGVGEGDRTQMIHYTHMLYPDWDENRAEALNKYRQSYFATGTAGSVGFGRQAYDTSMEHLVPVLEAAKALNNEDSALAPISNIANSLRGTGGEQAAKINNFKSKVGILAPETARFLTGQPATIPATEEQQSKWKANMTPRQLAAAAESYLEMLEGKRRAMETDRTENFGQNPGQDQYPIGGSEKTAANIAKIKSLIADLKEQGGESVDRTSLGLGAPVGGAGAQPPAKAPAKGGLPAGWSVK